MVSLEKVKMKGYKSFYEYNTFPLTVYVNSQDQFQAGQKDVYGKGNVLSVSQVERIRNMEAKYRVWDAGLADYVRKRLQVNGFDLKIEN